MYECDYLLEMQQITKSYGCNLILDKTNLRVKPGEIHGLVGKNGAGKTTLVNILYGAVPKDSGEILLKGKPIEINSVSKAREYGITKVHQDLNIFPKLSVAENIFVGTGKNGSFIKHGIINQEAAISEAQKVLEQLHFTIDPRARAGSLGLAKQQMVAIVRALVEKPKILILDEPTAALNDQEIGYFLQMLKKIQKAGVTIIYISHRLRELKVIANRVTVLRDGKDIDTVPAKALEEEKIIKMMVGLETRNRYPKLSLPTKKELLRIENLTTGNILHNISFSLYEGEILGIAGLAGSGRTTLMNTIFGILKPTTGRILLRGREVRPSSARQAIKLGFAYVMEDRFYSGLFNNLSVRELIDNELEKKIAQGLIRRLRVVLQSLEQKISTLSGGNQQKTILAKWLFGEGLVYLLDEPTCGLDIASKVDIYNIMNSIICRWAGIIMISSDLSELIGMSHRILVIHNGTIVRELSGEEATEEEIIKMASGVR